MWTLESTPSHGLNGDTFPLNLSNHVLSSVDLVLNNAKQEKSGGVRSGDVAGHVMYGEPLPVHFAGNCSSKNV